MVEIAFQHECCKRHWSCDSALKESGAMAADVAMCIGTYPFAVSLLTGGRLKEKRDSLSGMIEEIQKKRRKHPRAPRPLFPG